MNDARRSLAGAAAVAAGALWLLVWAHQRATHGPTELNEMRLALGLTWMDSAKLLVLSFALLLVTVVASWRPADSSRTGTVGFLLSIAGLGLLDAGVALEFWSFPWGSYAQSFDAPLPQAGGVVQAIGSLTLTLGLVPLAVDGVRRKAVSPWIAPLLPVRALTTFWHTPVLAVPGAVSLAVGLALLWQSARRRRRERISLRRATENAQAPIHPRVRPFGRTAAHPAQPGE